MTRRYALLVDGAFVCKKLGKRLGRAATTPDVLAECNRIKGLPALAGMELLRIYFYDAPPATGQIVHPLTKVKTNLGRTEMHKSATALHDTLELSPDFALRMGEVAIRGWRVREQALKSMATTGRSLAPADLSPNLQQKGVDLRIGLDIARLALRGLVEVIVVVTGDSDMVPAFKFARREGIRVYLDCLGHGVKRALKAHSDLVL